MQGEEIIFREKQRFTQWWLWLLFGAIAGAMLYQGLIDINFRLSSWLDLKAFIPLLMWSVIMIFFYWMHLEVVFTDAALYFRFVPFHKTFRKLAVDTIESIEVKTYKPLSEYMGWGIRIHISTGGLAYTTSGNQGIEVGVRSGAKYLFGTQKPQILMESLNKSKKYFDKIQK